MFKKILYYLNPFTLFYQTEKEENFNTRFMHGINRVSVYLFLLGIIILLLRALK